MHIIVVDDHKAMLHGFASVLQQLPFVKEVGQCSSIDELRDSLSKKVPDVIFLDLNLPPNNGLPICSEIARNHKGVCVAILTSYDDDFLIGEAQKCGARAYFLKSVDIQIIEKFLNDYHHGVIKEFFLARPHRAEKPGPAFGDNAFALLSALSKRENEVLRRIAHGKGHDEIMGELGISYDTYKSHRTHVMQKLKVKNVAELVQFAMRNNITSHITGLAS